MTASLTTTTTRTFPEETTQVFSELITPANRQDKTDAEDMRPTRPTQHLNQAGYLLRAGQGEEEGAEEVEVKENPQELQGKILNIYVAVALTAGVPALTVSPW